MTVGQYTDTSQPLGGVNPQLRHEAIWLVDSSDNHSTYQSAWWEFQNKGITKNTATQLYIIWLDHWSPNRPLSISESDLIATDFIIG